MTVVLVHGNPETTAIWDPLRSELGRDDAIALSPPGFGAPVPAGFGGTADEYLAWLVAELEQLDGPLDLVGHDWGGGHVHRIAATRPDLIRSWCTDVAGIADPSYVWHELALIWQTPGAGEEHVEMMMSAPLEKRVARLIRGGMTPEAAHACALAAGPEMGRCILALYRSATASKLAEWGEELDRAERRPALALIPTEDSFTGGETLARRSAKRFGADVAVLDGLGHWWMLEDPRRGAAALAEFLDRLE